MPPQELKYGPTVDIYAKIAQRLFDSQSVNVIVEVGARDCRETIRFNEIFPSANIFSFECNPQTLPICRKAVDGFEQIHLIEKAVTDHDGEVEFYAIDPNRTITSWPDGNPGASSLLKASGKYPIEQYIQREIRVQGITLETFMKDNNLSAIDLLWMDVQGAELMVLKGLGERINNVKLIHLEVEFFEIYNHQPLFHDLKKFLNVSGFLFLDFTAFGKYSADAVFVNRLCLKNFPTLFKHWVFDIVLPQKYFADQTLKQIRKRVRSALRLKQIRVRRILQRHMVGFKAWLTNDSNELEYYRIVQFHRSFGKRVSSRLMIDVLIPVAEKDMNIIPFAIDGLRENLRHPVGDILIVSSESAQIRELCAYKGCGFVPENSVLPITRNDIDYIVDGHDRSGWLFQQLLKWAGDNISSQEYFLVIDADTVLISPQVFEVYGKSVLLHSDEHHQPYFDIYERLFKRKPPTYLSFVSHQMLYRKNRLAELKQELEAKNDNESWYKIIINTIDKKQSSSISEYETYGQWMLSKYPNEIRREYWFNIPMARANLFRLEELKSKLRGRFRSVSFHNYL